MLLWMTQREKLRSKIGQILWVAKQTSLTVLFDTCSLSSKMKNATVQSMHEVNRVIHTLKNEKVILRFQYWGYSDDLSWGISDASLGNLSHIVQTQGGALIALIGREGKSKQNRWGEKHTGKRIPYNVRCYRQSFWIHSFLSWHNDCRPRHMPHKFKSFRQ